MRNRHVRWFLLLVVAGLLAGCNPGKGPPASAKGAKAPATKGEPAPKVEGLAPDAVHRIVLLEKKDCCDCTNERQAKVRDLLQARIEKLAHKPVVETIYTDADADTAQLYLDIKPVMVTPGIYFFDGTDTLKEFLQGELTDKQLLELLGQ